MLDTLGVAGKFLYDNTPFDIATILKILSAAVAVAYSFIRLGQRWLQRRRTIWRYIDNRFTLRLIDRIIGWLFGKTTLIYESKIFCREEDREAATREAARITATHMLRKEGSDMLKAFSAVIQSKDTPPESDEK